MRKDQLPSATFRDDAHYAGVNTHSHKVVRAVKTILPLILAIIPLAVMVGACITCP
jgi:predicted branched-subunit amino acid permease